ncbi:hypothetical protein EXIGLDRAFT_829428 [Exidia glandulosa HHB12029]|uniref:Uncharacterized protein n=1 Tax=Exidia glandulosa HHB12029 TaxID=1314781 RepID=A0A165PIA1_EXIGL|nr:hypothetical protein EXIGLDRAFT_829428 [Exidia glandulosa HHB12029]
MSYTVVPTITSRPRGRGVNPERGYHSLLYLNASSPQAPCGATKPALLVVPQRKVESERMPFPVQEHYYAPIFASERDEDKLPVPPIFVREPELHHPRPEARRGYSKLAFTVKRFESELAAREDSERKSIPAQPLRTTLQQPRNRLPPPHPAHAKAYWPEGLPPLPEPPKKFFWPSVSQKDECAMPPPLLRTQSDPGAVVDNALLEKDAGLRRGASTTSRRQPRPLGPRSLKQ